ncbi:MAG: asparagine synthase-related protein, partial [Planctomycetota bacterium]
MQRNEFTLILRGLACATDSDVPASAELLSGWLQGAGEDIAARLMSELEGSYSFVLIEKSGARAWLYRNLISGGPTYYWCQSGALLFSSNLASLLGVLPERAAVREEVLPSVFLFRTVPGRQTPARGVDRLMPGELLKYESGRIRLHQSDTFAQLRQSGSESRASVSDALDRVVTRVLTSYAAVAPGAAGLLSGGVDSTYLQALWNRVLRAQGHAPVSCCATLDHPMTAMDASYAKTAAAYLGNDHAEVQVSHDYVTMLREAITATGELPNHVQSAYFLPLARWMQAQGHPVGICGEGADSLFGVGSCGEVQQAMILRRLVPRPLARALFGS